AIVTGGKFANGAVSAAFAHLWNAESHREPGIGHNGGPNLDEVEKLNVGRINILRVLLSRFPLASIFIPTDQLGNGSMFEDITAPGSTTQNYKVNMSMDQFEQNLVRDGFTGTQKGIGTEYINATEERFYIRDYSKSGPPTADYYPSGSRDPAIKYRFAK
ncbi:hypothetical protein, partial [Rhodomicrobium lacus]|uniref:hypothetical protein n=1 Tax=Rhodomicrobium lacus TaxID=2498452 RepID=UPI001AECF1C4